MEHSHLEFQIVLWPLHFGRRNIYKLVLGSSPSSWIISKSFYVCDHQLEKVPA